MSAHNTAAAVRATVAAWQFRTLRVQDRFELERTLAVLEPHEPRLAEYSAHAPRLLTSLREELAARPPEPPTYCARSKHTPSEDGKRCVVCGCQVRPRTAPATPPGGLCSF